MVEWTAAAASFAVDVFWFDGDITMKNGGWTSESVYIYQRSRAYLACIFRGLGIFAKPFPALLNCTHLPSRMTSHDLAVAQMVSQQ